MFDFLVHNWGWVALAAFLLNLGLFPFFFKNFFSGSLGAYSGATDMLGKSLDIEVKDGKEGEALVKGFFAIAKGFFGPLLKKMGPIMLVGLLVGLLYLGALVGFIGWLIRLAIAG